MVKDNGIKGIFQNLLSKGFTRPFRKRHKEFALVYSSPWPGDVENAQLLLQGNILINDQSYPLSEILKTINNPNAFYINSFEWLLDLRSISDNASRKLSRQLILHWIQNFTLSKLSNPALTSSRISNWISCFDFFGSSADDVFLNEFYRSLTLQLDILAKGAKKSDNPLVFKGLILGYITLGYPTTLVKHAAELFTNSANKLLLPDGGHVSRDPLIHFYLLKDILDVRTVLRMGQYDEHLTPLIQKMVPILRLLRSGEGMLGHNINKYTSPHQAYIDSVLSVADIKGRPASKAPDMGYERLNTKSGLLILNTKPKKVDFENFYGPGTGVLNFEWTFGTHQYIKQGDVVIQTGEHEWLQFDHQTPQSIQINRTTQDGHAFLETNFESVISKAESYLLNHQRQLYLGAEEGDFRGQDKLTLSKNALCAIRFIFPKGIVLTASAHSAIIHAYGVKNEKTKTWHFHCSDNVELSVDYHEGDSALLLLTHLNENKPTHIKWAFKST